MFFLTGTGSGPPSIFFKRSITSKSYPQQFPKSEENSACTFINTKFEFNCQTQTDSDVRYQYYKTFIKLKLQRT